MEIYQIILIVVGGLLILLFMILKMIPTKKKNKEWNIIERKPIGEEDMGGWYAENKISKKITILYPTKQELGRALFNE